MRKFNCGRGDLELTDCAENDTNLVGESVRVHSFTNIRLSSHQYPSLSIFPVLDDDWQFFSNVSRCLFVPKTGVTILNML